MTGDSDIQARLRALRDELTELSERSADSRKPVTLDQQSVGRLSRMDAIQAQAMARAAEQRRATEVARIDAALGRLEAGTYGVCMRCEQEIETGRLDFDAAATLCASCARDVA